MKAIIHAINDDNVPGLQHLLGSLNSYDINQPNKVSDATRLHVMIQTVRLNFLIRTVRLKFPIGTV